jgi:hypothetical protein
MINNKINGKKYFGITVNYKRRFNDHKSMLRRGTSKSKLMQEEYDKYGKDSFEMVLIGEYVDKNAGYLEISLIKRFKTTDNEYGYNTETGGLAGYKLGEEQKKRIGEANRRGRINKKLNHIVLNPMSDDFKKEKSYKNSGQITSRNTSGFRGVTRDNQRNKWVSKIRVNYKSISIGRYESKEEAAKAFDKVCYDNFHELNRLNFPNEYKAQ